MAYTVPLDQPLSETQAKLIAQVGTMKNLANLSFLKKFKFKREENMSLFDYLLKILRSMGIDPEIILTAFLNDFFRTDKVVDFLITAIARLATSINKQLDSNAQLSFTPGDDVVMDDARIKELNDSNYKYLNNFSVSLDSMTVPLKPALYKLIDALRTRMIQELMVIIFGKPKKAVTGPNGMVTDDNRMNELIDESVCGGETIFSVSNPAAINFGDLEYNRLQKLEKAKNGNLSFSITCQGVQITLPDDPMYLFKSVPPGFQGGESVSPEEAMTNVFNFVSNQVQKQTSGASSQSNASSAGKSFIQKFLESLIASITTLVKPFFVGIIGTVPGEAQGLAPEAFDLLQQGLLNMVFPGSVTTDPNTGKRVGDYVPPSSCEINSQYQKGALDSIKKKKVSLIIILCNLLLNIAIGFIMAYVLEKIKKMIKKYVAKRAQEKAARKIQKLKDKYATSVAGRQKKKTDRAVRQIKLMKKIFGILQANAGSFTPTPK